MDYTIIIKAGEHQFLKLSEYTSKIDLFQTNCNQEFEKFEMINVFKFNQS